LKYFLSSKFIALKYLQCKLEVKPDILIQQFMKSTLTLMRQARRGNQTSVLLVTEATNMYAQNWEKKIINVYQSVYLEKFIAEHI
jgi:hypothetical protein